MKSKGRVCLRRQGSCFDLQIRRTAWHPVLCLNFHCSTSQWGEVLRWSFTSVSLKIIHIDLEIVRRPFFLFFFAFCGNSKKTSQSSWTNLHEGWGTPTEDGKKIQHLWGITALICIGIAIKQLKKAHTSGSVSPHRELSATARRN